MKKPKYSISQLIQVLKEIYSKEGITGLIPKNLYDNHRLEFYIRKYKKEEEYEEKVNSNKKRKPPGYPDEWCCQKINILEERKEYLKKTFPCETETFEEMCEIHIRPFLDNRLKNIDETGFILDMDTFTSNGRCDIRSGLNKHKKDIRQVRQHFNLSNKNLESLRKDEDGYYQIRNSKAEVVFDNFLVLYTDLTNENVKWEEPYPQDCVNPNYNSDCTIRINSKVIVVEIWRWDPNSNRNFGNKGKERKEYLKRRKIKEDYWKTRDDIIFIGIENENLYCNQSEFNAVTECKNILSPYIDNHILDKPTKIEYNVFPKNEYNRIIDHCQKSIDDNDGLLFPDKLNKSILKLIQRHYGGTENIKKKLYGDKFELNKIKHKEITSNNISKSRKKFSKEKWTEIHKRTQEKLINDNGGVHPMIGKKLPRHTKEEYETMYAPLICKFLQSLNDGDKINPSSDKWRNYCKPTIMPYTPWNNKPDYNPWYESKWIGFIETGIKYAEQNDITLPNFYYKNVVSSDKKNKKKKYEDEDVWNIHINFIKYCDENKIEKTKKNADKYFRDKKFIMTIDTLISKNNKNSEVFGTGYKIFLERISK